MVLLTHRTVAVPVSPAGTDPTVPLGSQGYPQVPAVGSGMAFVPGTGQGHPWRDITHGRAAWAGLGWGTFPGEKALRDSLAQNQPCLEFVEHRDGREGAVEGLFLPTLPNPLTFIDPVQAQLSLHKPTAFINLPWKDFLPVLTIINPTARAVISRCAEEGRVPQAAWGCQSLWDGAVPAREGTGPCTVPRESPSPASPGQCSSLTARWHLGIGLKCRLMTHTHLAFAEQVGCGARAVRSCSLLQTPAK